MSAPPLTEASKTVVVLRTVFFAFFVVFVLAFLVVVFAFFVARAMDLSSQAPGPAASIALQTMALVLPDLRAEPGASVV